MDYRREIDGLRAIAVIPVILFHAGFETFSGGFVGVDVFFVISGYLITTIILAELEQGKFSIVNFYERRARRILPALFFVMLVCIPFAWFWLSPDNLLEFCRSLVAVVFFSSNILFWREDGYFANAAAEKPLLHTWSLAVEEQYYVLFPIFLMLFWKLGKRWILIALGLVFVVSLAVAQWAAYAKPVAAFYLLPTRGWELLIGAFAAFYLSKTSHKEFGKRVAEIGGWLGVALILYAVLTYSKATPFPGFYALVPTLGTVLVILFATQQTTVGRFVGNKAFVGVGLISYSAYLWHQPLFAFSRYESLTEPSKFLFVALSAFSLVLAYLSWKFVETPFRSNKEITRLTILKFSIIGAAAFGLVGSLGIGYSGFPSRLTFYSNKNVSEKDLRAVMDQYGFRSYPEPNSFVKDSDTGLMRMGSGFGNGVLLVGDSHSYQYWNTFDDFFSRHNSSDNRQLKSLYLQAVPFLPELGSLKLNNNTETVVISYFWSLVYRSASVNQYIRCCGGGPKGVVGVSLPPNNDDAMNLLDQKLARLIDELRSRSIRTILVLDNPFGEELNPKSMLRIDGLKIYPTEYFAPLSRKIALARSEPVRSRLLSLAREHKAEVLDPFNYLCDEIWCSALSSDGYMRYKDYDHISLMTATKGASYILKVLD